MILEDQPDIEVVGEATDGKAGVELAQRLQPDVVVMDIRMPVLDGIEATRRIVRDGVAPNARVLILTTFDADENVVEALRAGASGFLLKDVTPADFVAAIRTIADGRRAPRAGRHPPAARPLRRPAAARERRTQRAPSAT